MTKTLFPPENDPKTKRKHDTLSTQVTKSFKKRVDRIANEYDDFNNLSQFIRYCIEQTVFKIESWEAKNNDEPEHEQKPVQFKAFEQHH